MGRDDMLQLEETVTFGLELVPYEKEPFWMGEIGCSKKLYSLDFGPVGQSIEDHIPGSGTGKLGMDVKVCDEFHLE